MQLVNMRVRDRETTIPAGETGEISEKNREYRLLPSGSQGLDHIVFGDDMVVPAIVFTQYRAILPGDKGA